MIIIFNLATNYFLEIKIAKEKREYSRALHTYIPRYFMTIK